MYNLLRKFLFLFDPEKVHYFSMNLLKVSCRMGLVKKCIASFYTPKKATPFNIFGLNFPNKIGLGAGFDKNAQYLEVLQALGFGFVEIGTVTPLPQAGNDKPRLFRLPKDKALLNRMGFNNDGANAVAQRLKTWRDNSTRKRHGGNQMIIGGNIGKNKMTVNEDAWKDYVSCFKVLQPYVDYFVVNVSSPNTPGLRALQEKDALRKILTSLQSVNIAPGATPRPILLKIAPDLSWTDIDDIIDLSLEIKLDGLVASNTTTDRSLLSNTSKILCESVGAGGLSGSPVKNRSTAIIQYICKHANGKIPVIASGGIFTAADANEKIQAGASLLQVWTGFIYEGPGIVNNICKGLRQ